VLITFICILILVWNNSSQLKDDDSSLLTLLHVGVLLLNLFSRHASHLYANIVLVSVLFFRNFTYIVYHYLMHTCSICKILSILKQYISQDIECIIFVVIITFRFTLKNGIPKHRRDKTMSHWLVVIHFLVTLFTTFSYYFYLLVNTRLKHTTLI
jgi:hypothetical protein